MKQKLLFLFTCTLLTATSFAQTSGACGPNLTWTFDEPTGTLTISGTGEMYWYDGLSHRGMAPWSDYYAQIEKVIMEEGVTSIGACAFYLYELYENVNEDVAIEEVISIIALADYKNLTSVVIPNSVTSIGYSAFSSCIGLRSITIPESVVNMGGRPGWGLFPSESLETINFNAIRANAGTVFENLFSLKTVNFGDKVEAIPDEVFSGCSNLSSVNMGENVKTIGGSAFSNCTSLTSIIIPGSVEEIKSDAFAGCISLTSITIPNSVKEIWDGAFSGCTGLNSMTIPESVTSIGKFVFQDCINLSTLHFNAVKCQSTTSFQNLLSLKTVNFGDKIEAIPDGLLSGCSNLNSVSFGRNVKTIGNSVFSDCTGLASITIPDNVEEIGDEAFSGCTGLTSMTIPESITSIGEFAFKGCINLSTLHFNAANCTEIGGYKEDTEDTQGGYSWIKEDGYDAPAFAECSSLKTLTIGADVKFIAAHAFKNLPVQSVTIPASVERIGISTFAGCKNLESVIVANDGSLESIGDRAFRGCSNLTSITIPENVKHIGGYVFYDCLNLTTVNYNAVNAICERWYDGTNYLSPVWASAAIFEDCETVTTLNIGNKVEVIPNIAFSDCTSLTEIIIPNSVASIGYSAFYYCLGLTSINIPNSVTNIGDEVFYFCEVEEVTVGWATPLDISEIFSIDKSTVKLYVPAGTADLYRAAPVWQDFMIEESTGLTSVTVDDSPVISTQYYELQGIAVSYPQAGQIYIVKELHQSGQTTVRKIAVNGQ